MRRPVVLAVLCATAALAVLERPALAQDKDNTIAPGMTKAEVIAHLGPPQSQHKSDTLLFLYYKNGCEKTCGMLDLVTLANDKVIDAIFRDPNRHYTGQSSSPASLTPAEARAKGAGGQAKAKPDTTNPGKAIVIPAPKPVPAPAAAPAADSAKARADSLTPPKDSAAAKPPGA